MANLGVVKQDEFPPKDDTKKRIGRLDAQTLGYYRRVSETLQDDFETLEEKELFLNNVFTQLSKEVFSATQNQTVSVIVESLLHAGNQWQIQQFMNALAKDWELACTDRFACHVTQTLVLLSSQYLVSSKKKSASATKEQDTAETLRSIRELFLELVSFLMSSLALYMQHTYASHIVRVVVEVLGGQHVSEHVIRSKISRARKINEDVHVSLLPADMDMLNILYDISKKISHLPRLTDHAKNRLSNPVLQSLLLVMKEHDGSRFYKLCKKIISSTSIFGLSEEEEEEEEEEESQSEKMKTEEEEKLPELLCDEVGSHLAEQLLAVMPEELYNRTFEKYLQHQLLAMAVHPTANYVVRSVISTVHTVEQFEVTFETLADQIETILANNHMGVIVQLGEGALKHGTKQKAFSKNLLMAFHCYEPAKRRTECVPLICSMMTHDMVHSEDSEDTEKKPADSLIKVNIHGSLLLQTLFKFGDPKLFVNSLLQMDQRRLVFIACDPCGSHIMDVFAKSAPVGERSRELLVNKLKGGYMELACSKNGSRSLEALWAAIPVKMRCSVADELAASSDRLQADQYGRYIWHNFGLFNFTRRRAEWKDMQMDNIKKRKLFSEIIGVKKEKRRKEERYEEEKTASLALNDKEEESVAIDDLFTVKKRPHVPEIVEDIPQKTFRSDKPFHQTGWKERKSKGHKHGRKFKTK